MSCIRFLNIRFFHVLSLASKIRCKTFSAIVTILIDVGFVFTTVLTFYRGESMNLCTTKDTPWLRSQKQGAGHASLPRFMKREIKRYLRI